jgi:hypothetical protein
MSGAVTKQVSFVAAPKRLLVFTTTMPLFNRTKKQRGDTPDNGQENGERKKEKAGWRKPAS